MGDFADDLSMDYSCELADTSKEMCYCGRMVTEEQQVFVPSEGITLCIFCKHEQR